MYKQLVDKNSEDIYPILSSQHETIPEWFIIYQKGLTDQTFVSPLGNSYTVKHTDIGARIADATTVKEAKVITDYSITLNDVAVAFIPTIYGSNSFYIHCPYYVSSSNSSDFYTDGGWLPIYSNSSIKNQSVNVQAEYTAIRIPKKDGSTDWILQGHLSVRGFQYSTTFNICCHNNPGYNGMPCFKFPDCEVNGGYCVFEILEEI